MRNLPSPTSALRRAHALASRLSVARLAQVLLLALVIGGLSETHLNTDFDSTGGPMVTEVESCAAEDEAESGSSPAIVDTATLATLHVLPTAELQDAEHLPSPIRVDRGPAVPRAPPFS